MPGLIPFHHLAEEQASREVRDVTFKGHPIIPDDSYALLEYYCVDPECDCQLVVLEVFSKRLSKPVGRLIFKFAPVSVDADSPNPCIDRMVPQAPYIDALRVWLAAHLRKDTGYTERLRRHYQQVKEAVADPTNPACATARAWLAAHGAQSVPAAVAEEETVKRRRARVTPAAGREPTVPVALRARYEEVTALTDRFCDEGLDVEYRNLSRQMAAALARKKPSSLTTGKANLWAAGIVYALGQVNFLFDKSQEPHSTPDEIGAGFGVSKTSASTKARQIRDLLHIGMWDPKWTRPSQIGQNPAAWMISVNGMIVDVRYMPREIQEQAYRQGLIPYIPDEPPKSV
jgi:hypothetical protein